ncbi:hypothetical protein [Lysobacter gummosus]|uniref:hypothetical protein n=1 Tax=Lysobacter gummosus TaxID=262324 RepID=UPI00362D12C5
MRARKAAVRGVFNRAPSSALRAPSPASGRRNRGRRSTSPGRAAEGRLQAEPKRLLFTPSPACHPR